MTKIKRFWNEEDKEDFINAWLKEKGESIKVVAAYDMALGMSLIYEEK